MSCGLGAAISALEGTTGRPIVWATAQYLSFAGVGSVVDIDVTVAVEGHRTTQARAVAHVGGSEIITVNAALGSRDDMPEVCHVDPPDVQPPTVPGTLYVVATPIGNLSDLSPRAQGVLAGVDRVLDGLTGEPIGGLLGVDQKTDADPRTWPITSAAISGLKPIWRTRWQIC